MRPHYLYGALLWATTAHASLPACELAGQGEAFQVHLLSVAPGADLMNSMGHTVLVFSGGPLDQPRAYNWGVFDGAQPGLIPKFLSGQLQYYLVAFHWDDFRPLYVAQDRTMVGQRLSLSEVQADRLFANVDAQARSAERAYTYHWAEANCATKARDAIDEACGGALRRALNVPVSTTARHEAARHFAPWVIPAFAWQFIASQRVDEPLTAWQRTMVPENLMSDLHRVTLTDPDGHERPLIADTCLFYEGRTSWAPAEPPSWWPMALPGALGGLAVLGAGLARSRRVVGALALVYGGLLGLLGSSSLVLWLVSALDGVGPTESWLVAGPQSFVFVLAGLWLMSGRPLGRSWGAAVGAVLGIALLSGPIKLLPGLHQNNVEVLVSLLPGLFATGLAMWLASRPLPTES